MPSSDPKLIDEDGVVLWTADIKTLADATYPANAAIAAPYDSTASYAVGDYCLKSGLLYKCNTAIATGGETWNSSHWTQTSAANEFGIGGINENLLDNWYFVGGGSQQNGHQFPINQRGQTTYSSNGLCLDRWETEGSMTISSSYVTTGSVFRQGCRTSLMDVLLGKTVTLSCLRADGTLVSGQITLPSSYPDSVTKYQAATGLYIALYSSGGGQIFRIEGSQNVVAVKLELGNMQTLAHQENGTWALNEIPNYEEQLIKCKTDITINSDYNANQKIAMNKVFSNTVVPTSAFDQNTSSQTVSPYTDYPCRATVQLTGVDSSMIPDVIFALSDATSGNYAPIAETYTGGVYIYSMTIPSSSITIPTIICWAS